MKKLIAVFLVLGCILTLAGCGTDAVTRLSIVESSLYLAPGESMQLTYVGYTKDDALATNEQMADITVLWGYSGNGAFVVDENGYLTAISKGTGNVWITDENGERNSRPVTVHVQENDT